MSKCWRCGGGKTITVAGGVVTEEVQPETEAKKEEEPTNETPEDMELKEKLAAAEARIKELESAIQTSTQNTAKAEAKAKSFENRVKSIEEQMKKIENTTVGDSTPPVLATTPSQPGAVVNDPMQAFFKKMIIDKRNTD